MPIKTKILIVTDSHVLPTGFAETTRLIFNGLLSAFPNDYELLQIGLCHVHAVTECKWTIIPTLTTKSATGQERYLPEDACGQITFPRVVDQFAPDIVFAFNDPQRLAHLCIPANRRSYKLVLYVTLDGGPMPKDCLRNLQNADRLLTMTDFSKDLFLSFHPSADPTLVQTMYSPADTARFSLITPQYRSALRASLLPDWIPQDAFIIGWVGRNQWRKQVWKLYQIIHYLRSGQYLQCNSCGQVTLLDSKAWRSGAAILPPQRSINQEYRATCRHCKSTHVTHAVPMLDAILWLHMAQDDPMASWSVKALEAIFHTLPGVDIHYTTGLKHKASLAPEVMQDLFGMWDMLLYPSGGEGFGIPVWEAMCSGLPIVCTEYSGHAELVVRGGAGITVGGEFQPEPGTCIFRLIASTEQCLAAITSFKFTPSLRSHFGASGRRFVETYSVGHQASRWNSIFKELCQPSP